MFRSKWRMFGTSQDNLDMTQIKGFGSKDSEKLKIFGKIARQTFPN